MSQDISEIQRRLEQLVERLRSDLLELAALLGLYGPQQQSKAAEQLRSLFIPPSAPSFPELVPSLPQTLTQLGGLSSQGIKSRPFDDHLFAVANEPLNNTGNVTDIGRTVDFIMVVPTIDAQIEFDRDIQSATPVVSGGTVFRHPQKTRTIHHKAISTTLTGQLFYWAYWWVD